MFREIILPMYRSTRLCVTDCGIMHPRCCRPTASNIVGVRTNRLQEQHTSFSVRRECRIPFFCDNSQQTGFLQPPHSVAVLLKPGPAGTAPELFSNNIMTIPAFHPPSLPYECNGREKASSTDSAQSTRRVVQRQEQNTTRVCRETGAVWLLSCGRTTGTTRTITYLLTYSMVQSPS